MHRHEMNEHDNESWGGSAEPGHHGRRGGGKRYRARFAGPPGFDPGAEQPGPRGPGYRARAEFGGPGGGEFPPDFGRPFHGGPGLHGGPPGFGPRSRGYGRRGGRAKRGDVRAAALALLAEEPMNGYQIIQQISERSGGLWRPSPGSVYPALAQLEDENLIALQASAGERRAYALTDAGRALRGRACRGAEGAVVGHVRRRRQRRRGHALAGPPGPCGGVSGPERRHPDAAGRGTQGAHPGPPVALPDPGRGRGVSR